MEKIYDILFIDGVEDRIETQHSTFITYLFSIASVLEEFGYSFRIFNLTLLSDYSLSGMLNELRKIKFSSIGITTNSDNIQNVINIVNTIKNEFEDCPIILGGSQASFDDKEIMQKCNCDIIVRNEGEYILIKLLDFYIKGIGKLEKIKSITFKVNSKIIQNRNEKKYIDLNKLPLPYYQILVDRNFWQIPETTTKEEVDLFFKFINMKNNFILLSRGCPYNCIFCVEGSLDRNYRQLNIDKAIQSIEHFLNTTKAKTINIADSTLTTSSKRVKELCSEIKKLQLNYSFKWYAEGRANILAKNPELIGLMHDAGLFCLQIGIESGSDKILQIQQKKITTKQIKVVAKEIGKYDDIMLTGHVIIGNPGETKSTLHETVEFIKELFVLTNFKFDIRFGYLVPYVGTPIRERPKDYGLDILINQFEYKKIKGYNDVIIKPIDLSLEEIENFYFEIRQELNIFFRNNIFKLPKKQIDNLMNFYKGLEKDGMLVIDNPWINSLYSLIYIQKYYYIYNQKTTINDIENIFNPSTVYPLRLCDFFYNDESECYNFVSMRGEEIKIDKKDKYLWEMANGKYTIKKIIEKSNVYFSFDPISMQSAIQFYQKMYLNFVLVFKEV